MMLTPKINNRLPQKLPTPIERVLKVMFTGYQEVIVRNEFTSGLSGSRVFQVRPIHSNGPELPAVVKIDTAAAIQQEWQAYQSCIHNKLPTVAAIQGDPVFPPGNPLGGLRYGLAGEGVFDVVSLADYCQQATLTEIENALKRLFQAMAALWEQKIVQPDLHLQTTYDSFLPANLIIELSTPPADSESKWLHPTTAHQTIWQIGDVVQLAGFQPVEIAPDKQRLLLNSPDLHDSFRFYLTGVADLTTFDIGQPLQQPFMGIIRETRDTFLTQRIQDLLSLETDLTAQALPIDDDLQLPNPLAVYKDVLTRSFDAHIACIHGDLHLQNVLVEADSGHSYLIDFGKSRRDHALRDLLNLEMSLMISILPENLGEVGFSPTRLFDFCARLYCAAQHPDKIAAPNDLQRPFTILSQVRLAAQRYLFKPERWEEYYDALGLYLLSSLKFNNLDKTARLVAFWGAAVSFHLSQNSPDCTTVIAGMPTAKTHTAKLETASTNVHGVSQQVIATGGSSVSNDLPASSSIGDNLPPKAYRQLIGRSQEQTQLLNILRDQKASRLIVIVGLGGMGKTALAREICEHSQQEKLFDHIVWSSAKSEHFIGDRVVQSDAAAYNFDSLLSDIGRQCARIDITTLPPDQKLAAVADLLATRRVLVVMDNLETVPDSDDLVNKVYTIIGQSRLLITSRHQVNHDRAFTLNLRGFSEEEGIAFLQAEGQIRNVTAVAQAPFKTLLEIHEITGGAPLAMKLIVGQLSRQPISIVLKSLKEAAVRGQDYEFYRFVYWHSWELLDDNGRMALVDMSVFPPMSGGAAADVEAISQLESDLFWTAMAQLVTMSLVDKIGIVGQERYALHALTHYFILADITEEWVNDAT